MIREIEFHFGETIFQPSIHHFLLINNPELGFEFVADMAESGLPLPVG
jgi:hypothetical protein